MTEQELKKEQFIAKAMANKEKFAESFAEKDKTNQIAFAEWTQLNGWGLLEENKWIHKSSLVVSSNVLFDMYSAKAE